MPVIKLKPAIDDQRILIISDIGCGKPMTGNRERLRALLVKLRELGLEIHFAGVSLPESEKAATLPYVDQWVYDFSSYTSGAIPQRLVQKAKRAGRKLLSPLMPEERKHNLGLDEWFHPSWLNQARVLQRSRNYSRVMVMYIWNSAFLKAFPASCLKLIDAHDIFTNRNKRLVSIGCNKADLWFSVSQESERRGLLRADVVLGIQKEDSCFFENLVEGQRRVYTVSHFAAIKELPFDQGVDVRFGLVASDSPLNVISCNWFLNYVWPIIHRECPSATFTVAGKISRCLESSSGIERLDMQDNLQHFYQSILFAINPAQQGTGLKIKTVEALGHGRCVISTPWGAEGLAECLGDQLQVASSADDFANLIIQLLVDPKRTREAGRQACILLSTINENSTMALLAALQKEPASPVPQSNMIK